MVAVTSAEITAQEEVTVEASTENAEVVVVATEVDFCYVLYRHCLDYSNIFFLSLGPVNLVAGSTFFVTVTLL